MLSTKRLLLVEDEAHMRTALALVLDCAGYEVTVVDNGFKALELFTGVLAEGRLPFDLVITDVVMPLMGGGELVEHLKGLGISIPILAISGYADKETVVDLMRLGCHNFIDKPLSPDQLLEAVEETFETYASEAGGGR